MQPAPATSSGWKRLPLLISTISLAALAGLACRGSSCPGGIARPGHRRVRAHTLEVGVERGSPDREQALRGRPIGVAQNQVPFRGQIVNRGATFDQEPPVCQRQAGQEPGRQPKPRSSGEHPHRVLSPVQEVAAHGNGDSNSRNLADHAPGGLDRPGRAREPPTPVALRVLGGTETLPTHAALSSSTGRGGGTQSSGNGSSAGCR